MFGFGRKNGRFRLSTASESAVGLVRENNEDHLLIDGNLGVYCVSDGMGGGADGEQASEIVCAEIATMLRLQPADFAARMEAVCNAIICSNEAIYNHANEMKFEQMGATVSMLVFDPEDGSQAAICHIGDSRVYRLRQGEIRLLTRDHSVGAELARRLGSESEYSSRSNPLSHVLTRAVGTGTTVSPDWKKLEVQSGDRFLLCTDGVHDVLDERQLLDLVGRGPLADAKRRLSEAVLAGGAPDNFTFILLEVGSECC